CVQGDRQNRGYRVDGEDHIRGFDYEEYQQQRRRTQPLAAYKEFTPHVIRGHWHELPHQAQQRIFFRVNFAAPLKKKSDSAIHEQEPEAVDDPVEPSNQTNSSKDKGRAHDDGADNSPEQHAVLLLVRQAEVPEDK